jgi:hypothetical protein
MKVGEFEKGPNVNIATLHLFLPILIPSQESVAKSYQSTATAAAMENAVQQTSKFVPSHISAYFFSYSSFSAFYIVPLAVLVAYFAWRFYS